MWEWYEKRDPSRTASVPGLIGEPSIQDLFLQTGKQIDSDTENATSGIRTSSSPRTLNDLLSMTISAKEAQWGQQDESGALSTEFPVFGSDFFDDDSNASSDSGADHFEDSIEKIDYDTQTKYKSMLSASETIENAKRAFPLNSDVASEMLTPSVKVTKEYIKISLNNQCVELAKGWKLGDFDIARSQPLTGRLSKPKSIHFSPLVNPFKHSTTASNNHFSKQGNAILIKRMMILFSHPCFPPFFIDLPSYRSLLPATPERKDDAYESVHGGAYSVRPNMQESMVFLRKLFTQQHQHEGKTPFPNLLSPPDDPMRK
jgi:hypothetical protein